MRYTLLPAAVFAGLMIAGLLAFGALMSYRLIDSEGFWDMRGMHERMMGGGTDSAGDPLTQGASEQAVEIRDFAYAPGNLQVPVGARVTWTNYDDAPHTATDEDGSWDTGILDKGESASITFDDAGDYFYYCTVHPSMKARIRAQ